MCCASLWRRCVSSTILRRSSDVPSSSTTSSGVFELRSCFKAPTGAFRPTRHSPPVRAFCHPALPQPSTGLFPLVSAWLPKPAHPSASVSVCCGEDRATCDLTAPRRAAASTQRRLRDITSTFHSPCTTRLSPPAHPVHTPHSFSWQATASWG